MGNLVGELGFEIGVGVIGRIGKMVENTMWRMGIVVVLYSKSVQVPCSIRCTSGVAQVRTLQASEPPEDYRSPLA